MIRIHEIKIKALEKTNALPAKIEQRLHLQQGAVKSFCIVKESIDARQKPDIQKSYSLDVEFEKNDDLMLSLCKKMNIKAEHVKPAEMPVFKLINDVKSRPVVVGFGPCGIFAALALATAGLRPIVLERGPSMTKRIDAVKTFEESGILNPNANIQFGEGGAGTFSDGKLTTGTKSPYSNYVLKKFADAGADPSIIYKAKPHIGTDVLRTVVVKLRKEIESLGGEVLFETKLKDIEIKENKVCAAIIEQGGRERRLECEYIILATGHSARDTVRKLFEDGVDMQQKQFSMGLRIEHPQSLIDYAQYGCSSKNIGLGAADYKLSTRTKEGRGVYTFCMCPGGVVVNASSHEGCTVTNGMSFSGRDSGKANSAVLVDVRTSDFESESPLAGIAFQEKYERLAFELGGKDYTLPKEKYSEFVDSSKLKKCLPDFVYSSLKEAIPVFGAKLKGFDNPDAFLYGIESRSSSPVRITRSENGFAFVFGKEVEGLCPAGEGAGYAGGIMSAACDGIRTAVKILGCTNNGSDN